MISFFENHDEEKLLSEYFIPDIQKLIMSYINTPLKSFEDIDIKECIKTGDYIYYNEKKVSLMHYLFSRKPYLFDFDTIQNVKKLLENSKYLKFEHFQNVTKNYTIGTEMYWMVRNKMSSSLLRLIKLSGCSPIYYVKQIDTHTIIGWLCLLGMSNVLLELVKISGWKPDHFQITTNGKYVSSNTILHSLCKYKMSDTILELLKLPGWKPEHFQNMSKKKNRVMRTELYWVCRNKMSDIILNIKGWKPEHFLNRNYTDNIRGLWCVVSELYILCENKMEDIIKHVGFKLEHCATDIERDYLKTII